MTRNVGDRNSRANPRFHPTDVGCNLGLTRKFPTPGNGGEAAMDVAVGGDGDGSQRFLRPYKEVSGSQVGWPVSQQRD